MESSGENGLDMENCTSISDNLQAADVTNKEPTLNSTQKNVYGSKTSILDMETEFNLLFGNVLDGEQQKLCVETDDISSLSSHTDTVISKDNMELNEKQEIQAMSQVCVHVKTKMPSEKDADLEDNVDEYWNKFYSVHQDKFFDNRSWLFTEFLEITLLKNEKPSAILEVGCEVGNSVFPISHFGVDSNVHLYYCSFSSNAIKIPKENLEYNKEHCTEFVCDITNDEWNPPFALESLDIIILGFVLSAIQPEKLKQVVGNLYKYLKPGGMVLFRDYGRYDMAHLRFEEENCISENYYSRDDGTLIYFFTQDDVEQLFLEAGFEQVQNIVNIVDRRMQVNRGKQLKMYRVWIQCRYKKQIL